MKKQLLGKTGLIGYFKVDASTCKLTYLYNHLQRHFKINHKDVSEYFYDPVEYELLRKMLICESDVRNFRFMLKFENRPVEVTIDAVLKKDVIHGIIINSGKIRRQKNEIQKIKKNLNT